MIINAAGDALFTFLPLFLGYTAAKKFQLKPMLGLAIGAAMCYPGYPVICIVGRSRGCNDRFGRNAVPISGIYRLFRNSGHFGRLYGNGDPGHTDCMVCVEV